jgi:hypothetical protein
MEYYEQLNTQKNQNQKKWVNPGQNNLPQLSQRGRKSTDKYGLKEWMREKNWIRKINLYTKKSPGWIDITSEFCKIIKGEWVQLIAQLFQNL